MCSSDLPRNAVCRNLKGYKCTCNSGFEGETCSDVDECSINNLTCDADADCYDTPGGFQCSCRTGFSGTGQKCQKGQCQDSICAENKKCLSLNTFDCVCKAGFVDGFNDTCIDIDECLPHANTCHDQADCINSPGSYSCECQIGFHGNGTICVEGDCVDSDCQVNEQCINPRRSDCECQEGFYRDESEKCVDVDECESTNDCHHNAACSNTEGSYFCACETGFYGTGFSCLEGSCADPACPGNQTCISPTSTCHCSEGLIKIGKSCFDIDECSRGIHECPKRSNCINEFENYNCECFAGYDDKNCTNSEVMVCQVTDKGSECACRDGFEEQANGTCTDIDECSLGLHKCQKNLECINNSGDYACKPFCEKGFENTYEENCRDIDECALSIHTCTSEQECINTDGEFSCEE